MARGKRRGRGEGHVRRRKNGSYEARLPLPEGKYKSFYGKTASEALAKREEGRKLLYSGISLGSPNRPFGEYLKQWLATSVKGSVRESTYANHESIVRTHLIPSLGHNKLRRISGYHLSELYSKKLKSLSPGCVTSIHATASKALRQAVRWRLIPFNPAEDASPPRYEPKELTPLTLDEVRQILASEPGPLFFLAVFTGLRVGELLGLKWEDIDFRASTLRLVRQFNRKGELVPLKTSASKRVVEIPPIALESLASTRKSSGPIFSGIEPSHIVRDFLKPVLRRAGIEKHVTFHGLRHTFATLMLQSGADPKTTQGALGHARIAETMDTYSHFLPSLSKSAARRLNDLV